MRMPRGASAVLVFLFATIFARPASAVPFIAGDILHVTFDLTSGLAGAPSEVFGYAVPGQSDVFAAYLFVGSGSGVNSFTARLYDGDHLLGSQTIAATRYINSPYGEYAPFYFVSPSSLMTGVGATVIDFSSFRNGSINGAVDFTMDAGQIDTRRHYPVELFLGHAIGANQAYGARVWPHGESPTPEPASLLLIGAGLGALGLRLRRRAA